MRYKLLFLIFSFAFIFSQAFAQNIGIGIDTPQAKLHVNGTFKLKNGVMVNGISADSSFDAASDSLLPTQRAVKRFMQKGSWLAAADSIQPALVFRDSASGLLGGSLLALLGHYAYVSGTTSGGSFLSSYDISDPTNLILKNTNHSGLFQPQAIGAGGNYVCVGSFGGTILSLYDVSDPTNIVFKDSIKLAGPPTGIAIQGNFVYVTDYGLERLSIFDISNPNVIVARGFVSANQTDPQRVCVRGNYAYVLSGPTHGLCIYDISNPDNIVLKSFTTTNIYFPYSMALEGNYAYVLNGDTLVSVYDISNPDNIVVKGTTNEHLSQPWSLSVTGTNLFVTDGDYHSISVYDASDPDNIIYKGSSTESLDIPVYVASQGNYAYVMSAHNGRLCSFFYGKTGTVAVNDNGEVAFVPNTWEVSPGNNVYRVNGNVGIGTPDPGQKLSIVGGMTVDAGGANNGTFANTLRFGGDNHSEGIGSNNTSSGNQNGLDFFTSATPRLSITNWGFVGVNTISPANNLDVNGNMVIGNSYATAVAAPANGLLVQGPVGIGTYPTGQLDVNGTVNLSGITNITGNANISANAIINGNVGIGVPSPGQKLSVSGGIAIDRDGVNAGTFTNSLRFGSDASGEGIASKRTAGGNQNGLDFYTNSANRMVITNAGNVGIGLLSPAFKLDVTGNINVTGNSFVSGNIGIGNTAPGQKLSISGGMTVDAGATNTGTLANGLRFGSDGSGEGISSKRTASGNQFGLDFYTGGADRMVITSAGRVGIGTTAPNVPLEVLGSNGFNVGTYQYYNQSGSGFFNSSNVQVGIRASSVIVAQEFEANSDIRIKRNIESSSSQNDLAVLSKIRVADYQLKDSVYHGNRHIKGFIAQELEKVMPQAVHTSADYVPDIYCLSTSTEYDDKNKTLKVSLCKPHGLKPGDKVKLFAGDGMKEQYVSSIDNETTFTLKNWEIKEAGMNPVEKVFVWGKWVDDFHTVDYNQVFSLGISAIQQLAKENEELKTKTESLQQQIDELKKMMINKNR